MTFLFEFIGKLGPMEISLIIGIAILLFGKENPKGRRLTRADLKNLPSAKTVEEIAELEPLASQTESSSSLKAFVDAESADEGSP